jgi:serine acetyltransferase
LRVFPETGCLRSLKPGGEKPTVEKGGPVADVTADALRTLVQWAFRRWGAAGNLVAVICRLFESLFISIELPAELDAGPRLRSRHPHGIVLNPGVTLGADRVLRQNVTVGNIIRRDGTHKGVALADDGVDCGAGCDVVGDIRLGNDVRLGASALVAEGAPERRVMTGNSGRLIRVDDPDCRGPVAAP